MAQFSTPDDVIEAATQAKTAGYQKMEAYTPFPIEALNDALGYKPKIQYLVLLGGLIGAISGFALQYYASVIAYPIIVGGRHMILALAKIAPGDCAVQILMGILVFSETSPS